MLLLPLICQLQVVWSGVIWCRLVPVWYWWYLLCRWGADELLSILGWGSSVLPRAQKQEREDYMMGLGSNALWWLGTRWPAYDMQDGWWDSKKNSINTSPMMLETHAEQELRWFAHLTQLAKSHHLLLPVYVPLSACHAVSVQPDVSLPDCLTCLDHRIFLCTIGTSCWLWPIVVLCSCSPLLPVAGGVE